jgi:hypothetical protein
MTEGILTQPFLQSLKFSSCEKAVFVKLRQNANFETKCPIIDVDLVIWEEHSKSFGYISYSTRIEILENILNIDAR